MPTAPDVGLLKSAILTSSNTQTHRCVGCGAEGTFAPNWSADGHRRLEVQEQGGAICPLSTSRQAVTVTGAR
jgi:hypothetical protein